MMTEECIGGVHLERLAAFVVDHAEEFPECLPLLKEAFQALSTAERKIELLKQSFIQSYMENRRKRSKSPAVATDDHEDHSSTIVASSSMKEYCTEAEDAELMKDKENGEGSLFDKSENDIKVDPFLPHQADSDQSCTSFVDPSLLSKKNDTKGDSSPTSKNNDIKADASPVSEKNDIKADPFLPRQADSDQSCTSSAEQSRLPKKMKIPKKIAKVIRRSCKRVVENRGAKSLVCDTPITSANSSMESQEQKVEVTDEQSILLNTVVNDRDPFMFKSANSEQTTSSREVSLSPRKRRRSICFESTVPPTNLQQACDVTSQVPSFVNYEEVSQKSCKSDPVFHLHSGLNPSTVSPRGSPGLRVIPSALLMEKPEPLETQPLDSKSNSGSVNLHGDHGDHGIPKSNSAIGSGDSNKRTGPYILYFDINREIDKRNWLTETEIIVGIKKDPVLRGCWITVDSMKRVNNLITGYLIFPDVSSCFRAQMNGLLLNGFRARLKLWDGASSHGSLAQDTNSTSNSSFHHLDGHGIQGPASSNVNSSNETWLKRTSQSSQRPAHQRPPMPQHPTPKISSPAYGKKIKNKINRKYNKMLQHQRRPPPFDDHLDRRSIQGPAHQRPPMPQHQRRPPPFDERK